MLAYTEINTHFVNTCDQADLAFIIAHLQISPVAVKKASAKGNAQLRSYVGTKLANFLSVNNVPFITLPNLPSYLAQVASANANTSASANASASANPFSSASASASATRSKLTGAYTVVKLNNQATSNQQKAQMFTALQNCTTFAQFFATAPAKAVMGKSIVTASSFMAACLKRGWVVANPAP